MFCNNINNFIWFGYMFWDWSLLNFELDKYSNEIEVY